MANSKEFDFFQEDLEDRGLPPDTGEPNLDLPPMPDKPPVETPSAYKPVGECSLDELLEVPEVKAHVAELINKEKNKARAMDEYHQDYYAVWVLCYRRAMEIMKKDYGFENIEMNCLVAVQTLEKRENVTQKSYLSHREVSKVLGTAEAYTMQVLDNLSKKGMLIRVKTSVWLRRDMEKPLLSRYQVRKVRKSNEKYRSRTPLVFTTSGEGAKAITTFNLVMRKQFRLIHAIMGFATLHQYKADEVLATLHKQTEL